MPQLVDPRALQAQIQAAFQARLPSAIDDATAELVDTLVHEQVVNELAPYISQDILAKANGPQSQLDQRTGMQLTAKGLLHDPFTSMDQLGFRERPTAITYQTLAQMARRTPPVVAIHFTRINQMAAFSVPQVDEHSVGHRIVLRDRSQEMTPELERRARELTEWIGRCGNPDLKQKRPRFEKWLRMSTWDSLTYDQLNTEIVCTPDGKPAWWRPLDAATIRISDDLDDSDDTSDTIQYVQVYDDTIIAEFKESELMFGVRNPRTDIRLAGYGTSELELLVTTVTAMLNGIDYNAKFFSQGSVAKGMINFKGAVPEKELINFRRQWYSMLSGVGNAWRTPIVNSDDVQWVNMHTSNRDMEWSSFIDWLLKVTCAVYQIDPMEIGFQFGNSGQTSSMGDGGQEDKLEFSKDKGLVPLARFVSSQIDQHIIEPLDDRFMLEFVGINARTAEQQIELDTKEVESIKTINEKRAERDLDPLPGGDIVLHQVYLQSVQGQQQQGDDDGGPQLDGGNLSGQGLGGGWQDQDPSGDKAQDENGDGRVNPAVSEQTGGENIAKSLGPRILNLEVDL